MRLTGFGIGNYRSFDAKGAFIHDFGKNNSGKSNVLRFLQRLPDFLSRSGPPCDKLDRHAMGDEPARLGLSVVLDDEIPAQVLRECYGTDKPTLDFWIELPSGNVIEAASLEKLPDVPLGRLHDKVTSERYRRYPSRDKLLEDVAAAVAGKARDELAKMLGAPVYVPAIREVRKGEEDQKKPSDVSGLNLIPRLRSMQVPLLGNEAEQEQFRRVRERIQELLGVSDLVMEIPPYEDHIYLKMYGNRLPLDHFGTGVHELVIICTALAIHENRVVCIEEPEIHLYPELLRRFMRFLQTTSNRYFIATHSNVLLDADVPIQVYHVLHDGTASHVRKAETSQHARSLLHDLGYKASDLLQTNGIIWVEGPSDRVYINKWLDFSGSTFVEGIHYSIMFYGGACLANLTAADCGPTEEFIELLRINGKAIVVIDRDGTDSETPLKEYKERIRREIGDQRCWVTAGREIENYLPEGLIKLYLQGKHPEQSGEVTFGPDEKIDDCLARAPKPIKYSLDKKRHARQMCEVMRPEDLDCLDLKEWIGRILKAIGQWNAP